MDKVTMISEIERLSIKGYDINLIRELLNFAYMAENYIDSNSPVNEVNKVCNEKDLWGFFPLIRRKGSYDYEASIRTMIANCYYHDVMDILNLRKVPTSTITTMESY